MKVFSQKIIGFFVIMTLWIMVSTHEVEYEEKFLNSPDHFVTTTASSGIDYDVYVLSLSWGSKF